MRVVNGFGDDRFKFVSATESSSPFVGHDICSSSRFFNDLDLSHEIYTAHPNVLGQGAYASLIKEFMQNN